MDVTTKMKIEEEEKKKERTPTECFICGTFYDKEVGKGRRHKYIWDPLVGLIDYYFIVMDWFFDMPDKVKNRITRKKHLKTLGGINGNV